VKRPRPTVRLRLTALYAGLLMASTLILLGLSWWLMRNHLRRTLPEPLADDVISRLLAQYGIATIGTVLIAIVLGWYVAGRVLSPIRHITETARRFSARSLDRRIALEGPQDELRELGDTLDAMLDRLQGSVEAQRRFVANASHELRSPLTVIRTEAEVTLGDPEASTEELRAMGEIVLEAADRTEALLDGLLVLALSQRGLERCERVDLGALVRRAAAEVAGEAAARRVRVTVRPERAEVEGDPALLGRLVANLAENAVRHNEPGGFVEMSAERANGHAVLRVANSGARIPEESLARLTEPFQRLDRSAGASGSGLGLSIVRSVAEAHGGSLRLRGRPDGGLEAEVSLEAQDA
jgi:signal transduction histidine kinase